MVDRGASERRRRAGEAEGDDAAGSEYDSDDPYDRFFKKLNSYGIPLCAEHARCIDYSQLWAREVPPRIYIRNLKLEERE